jgi:hypothetical protein
MTNEIITIDVLPKSMIVMDGRSKGAKLWYQAPGLDIYVTGRVCACREHSVKFIAVEAAVSRHIPAISVKDVRVRRAPKIEPKNPRQRGMF